MGVIWIIERAKEDSGGSPRSLAKSLMGDHPVRLFASFDSFQKLLRFNRKSLPDLLIVDLDDCGWKLGRIQDSLLYYMPNTTCLIVGGEEADQEVRPPCRRIARPDCPMAFSRQVAAALAEAKNGGVLRFRDVQLNFSQVRLAIAPDGMPQSLPLKEAQILRLLLERPGICLGRDEIKKEVWSGLAVSSRTIDSHVSRLRKRLQDAEVRIESVYGGGYVLR